MPRPSIRLFVSSRHTLDYHAAATDAAAAATVSVRLPPHALFGKRFHLSHAPAAGPVAVVAVLLRCRTSAFRTVRRDPDLKHQGRIDAAAVAAAADGATARRPVAPGLHVARGRQSLGKWELVRTSDASCSLSVAASVFRRWTPRSPCHRSRCNCCPHDP